MIIPLPSRRLNLLSRFWRGALRPLVYMKEKLSDSSDRTQAEDIPTSEEIRALLEHDPQLAFEAYLRYREAGGVPHRFRPSEIRRLLSAGAVRVESFEEPALIP